MRVTISSAHGLRVRGASGLIDEVDESRRVVGEVVRILQDRGTTVTVFHDQTSTTQAANLNAIVAAHQRTQRDLDVSVHFNAFQKTDGARGTETLHRNQQAIAARISKGISDASGLINRGAKHRTNLAFLNRLDRAVLLEVCFVDAAQDVRLYQQHFAAITDAIARTIVGQSPGQQSPPPQQSPQSPPATAARPVLRRGSSGPAVRELQTLLGGLAVDGQFGPLTEAAVRNFQSTNRLVVDGIVGPITWGALLG